MKTVEPILDPSTLIKTNKWFKKMLKELKKSYGVKFEWHALMKNKENGNFVLHAGCKKTLTIKVLWFEPKELFKILNITPEQFNEIDKGRTLWMF